MMPLTEAQYRLGSLRELGRRLPNPYLLMRPLMSKEAVSSSSMEGTVTTLTDLFAFEAGAEKRSVTDETREVHNYVQALLHAIGMLGDLPVSRRLFCSAHAILLRGVSRGRGRTKRPGEFRTNEPAWTGTWGTPLSEARFVFTPPDRVADTFTDLEKYIAELKDGDLPVLVKIALIHYQFETIHPFHDGNGRLGRLLSPLLLCQSDDLPQPLLYLSPFFERYKDEYIHALFEVSRAGLWEQWIALFLRGVAEQARDTILRAHVLEDLQAKYRVRLSQARQSALSLQLVDMICEYPVVTIPQAQRKLKITYNSAKNNIEKLLNSDILVETNRDSRPKLFLAKEIYDAIHDPVDELATRFGISLE